MIINVSFSSNNSIITIPVSIDGGSYVLNLKEMLASLNRTEIPDSISQHGGPYSPDVVLSHMGIELGNMFSLSRYCISDNDTLTLSFKIRSDTTAVKVDTEKAVENTCTVCGRSFPDTDFLKYHSGMLSPYEWVYGLTVKWKWSCCGIIVSTPETCFHPEGCCSGICPDCRPGCACNRAREIRRNEEENF